jgi:hypothetical protein
MTVGISRRFTREARRFHRFAVFDDGVVRVSRSMNRGLRPGLYDFTASRFSMTAWSAYHDP